MAGLFVRYLNESCHCTGIKLRTPDQPAPDFLLFIDNKSYGLEVTGIEPFEKQVSFLAKLAEEIESRARDLGILYRHYILSTDCRHSDGCKKAKPEVAKMVEQAISFIGGTPSGKATGITLSKGRRCSIMLDAGESLNPSVRSTFIGGCEFEEESMEQLKRYLKDTLEKKEGKLKDVSSPIILLLFDRFGFANREILRSAFGAVGNCDWLHSLYWASALPPRIDPETGRMTGLRGMMLYSKNPTWVVPQ